MTSSSYSPFGVGPHAAALRDWFGRASIWGAREDPYGAAQWSVMLAEWAVGQGLAEHAGLMFGGQIVYRWLVDEGVRGRRHDLEGT
jgi:hypothetical protein